MMMMMVLLYLLRLQMLLLAARRLFVVERVLFEPLPLLGGKFVHCLVHPYGHTSSDSRR